jgi:tetratricopeptide (TPR) repeat protein
MDVLLENELLLALRRRVIASIFIGGNLLLEASGRQGQAHALPFLAFGIVWILFGVTGARWPHPLYLFSDALLFAALAICEFLTVQKYWGGPVSGGLFAQVFFLLLFIGLALFRTYQYLRLAKASGPPAGLIGALTWVSLGIGLLVAGKQTFLLGPGLLYTELSTQDAAQAYMDRGFAFQDTKEYSKAIEEFTKVIEIDPQRAHAWYARGTMHGHLHNWHAAVLDFNKALELKPDHAEALHNRGIALKQLGKIEEGQRDIGAALSLKPDSDYSKHTGIGDAHRDKGEHDKAIAQYQEAIKIDPNREAGWFLCGLTRWEQRDYARAITDFTKAIERDAKSARSYAYRGFCRFQLREADAALADFNKAIDLDPEFSPAYVGRATYYFYKGERAKVREDYGKAKTLDPKLAIKGLENY